MCNCFKHTESEYDRLRALAQRLSKEENTDYVIYEYEGRLYADRLECWTKGGRLGRVRAVVCVQ